MTGSQPTSTSPSVRSSVGLRSTAIISTTNDLDVVLPSSPLHTHTPGNKAFREGEYRQAIEHFSKAIAISGGSPAFYGNRWVVRSPLASALAPPP